MVWMYAVCALSLFVCLPFFMYYKKALHYRLASVFKSLGTLCAALFAFIAAVRLDQHCWICFAALLLHAAADYLLEFNILWGEGFFLAGHICYIAFFTHLVPVSAVHLISAVCLLGVMAFLLWRWRKAVGDRMLPVAVYGVVLSLTVACAIGCLSAHTIQGQLIALGGALFFISDSFVLGRLLFSASHAVDWTIMILYYAAQLLIGISCLF